MRRQRLNRCLQGAALSAACLSLSACSTLGYYAQAAQGQYALLAQARPIDDWLADPRTSAQLRGKLQSVREIRRFAVTQLALPDNGSYKNYAQLSRQFVVWNVVAAPALSLQAHKWCFPIAGCVDYRGYYDQQEAQAYAERLTREGYDVQVAGVPAYSTLGWFDDPVISTFINYPDGELARLIFHELAHQVLYVKGDSQFNESYATTVEELGVERWLQSRHDEQLSAAYQAFAARKQEFLALLLKYRGQLELNYQSDAGNEEKLQRKAQIFDALRAEYQQLKLRWSGYAGYDRWFAMPLSNAHLALIGTYHDRVPAFRELYRQSTGFADFLARVNALAALDKPQRDAALDRLQAGRPALLQSIR
jgi:predicted aminopeptidase